MIYRNKRTGVTVETDCVISGDPWEPMEPKRVQDPPKTPAEAKPKKGGKKK